MNEEVKAIEEITSEEYKNMIDKMTNAMEHEANVKCSNEVEKANTFRDGYIQACEDYNRRLKDIP